LTPALSTAVTQGQQCALQDGRIVPARRPIGTLTASLARPPSKRPRPRQSLRLPSPTTLLPHSAPPPVTVTPLPSRTRACGRPTWFGTMGLPILPDRKVNSAFTASCRTQIVTQLCIGACSPDSFPLPFPPSDQRLYTSPYLSRASGVHGASPVWETTNSK